MRLIAFLMMLGGLIMMIFVTEDKLFLIFLSIALTSMANMMIWASQLQIANLFRQLIHDFSLSSSTAKKTESLQEKIDS